MTLLWALLWCAAPIGMNCIDSPVQSTLKADASDLLNSIRPTTVDSGPTIAVGNARVWQCNPASGQLSSASGVTVIPMPTLKGSTLKIGPGGPIGSLAASTATAAIGGNGSTFRVR